MKRGNSMLYTNVCPRSQFETVLFTSKKKTKQRVMRRRKRRRKGMQPFVYTSALALLIDCALYLRSDRAALYSAPSIDFVKQIELLGLSLSQCLNPWPSTTPNPKLLDTQNPVSHPPQVIGIWKLSPHPPLPPICILLFSSTGHFLLVCLRLFRRCSCFVEETTVDDETGVML